MCWECGFHERDPKTPFRFEDLNGRREPPCWGPKYSKPVKAKHAFNDESNIPTNCASGQKGPFDAAKHRAKIAAEFHAAAANDRRRWLKGEECALWQGTIWDAYKAAMQHG